MITSLQSLVKNNGRCLMDSRIRIDKNILLIEILKDDDSSHDVQIEIFGCLANMTMYDLPATSNWKKLMRDYNLLNLFCKMLVPGM